ncbi:metallophosphoesterase family protein [Nocardia aurantia]|uniref:3',5'-cyclic adenosine monophosphate phosphodiesterase CpdA n=1 Tax=Nocardia aurantia TaxID=2585199 RepID=A0A7K0DJ80_9NOCA|nr:metallophosphoesterase [Nocardia aurantia]MQY25865.1 3',5'-cyclic adenosine monophosphate phosphodiesterase CpdA [Nocardia aurantia]
MAGTGCARIAAVGDVHLGAESAGSLRPVLSCLPERADMLLLAGDLTRHGTLDEARVVATEFADLGVPVIAVLGNHDYHGDAEDEITALLTDHGIVVLEGTATTVRLPDGIVTVAGTKGFGGGFAGKCASAFGERIMREFARYTEELAASLQAALSGPRADVTVALTHYSPVNDTLHGEPPEIHPFLGSYLLGEAVDAGRADLAIHGHAHAGCEQGTTPGGVRVRNVAQPVIRTAFAVYELPIRVPEPAVAD